MQATFSINSAAGIYSHRYLRSAAHNKAGISIPVSKHQSVLQAGEYSTASEHISMHNFQRVCGQLGICVRPTDGIRLKIDPSLRQNVFDTYAEPQAWRTCSRIQTTRSVMTRWSGSTETLQRRYAITSRKTRKNRTYTKTSSYRRMIHRYTTRLNEPLSSLSHPAHPRHWQ